MLLHGRLHPGQEFSLVSYDLYKYLRTTPGALPTWRPFHRCSCSFGVRRSSSAESAQSYPGEFVSGNYFAMFGVRPYAGRLLTPTDDEPARRRQRS